MTKIFKQQNADHGEMNPHKVGFIKNKTHWNGEILTITALGNVTSDVICPVGSYIIYSDGVNEYVGKVMSQYGSGNSTAYLKDSSDTTMGSVQLTNDKITSILGDNSLVGGTLYSLKKLDNKFLDLTNAYMGQGIGECDTSADTTTKEVILSGYELVIGGIVVVKFTNSVPASATLNVNGKGAKAIYFNGSAITADVIGTGDIVTFMYDGTNYVFVSSDAKSGLTISSQRFWYDNDNQCIRITFN